jgi:hypothetical protein
LDIESTEKRKRNNDRENNFRTWGSAKKGRIEGNQCKWQMVWIAKEWQEG